jgi:hypothetical protein
MSTSAMRNLLSLVTRRLALPEHAAFEQMLGMQHHYAPTPTSQSAFQDFLESYDPGALAAYLDSMAETHPHLLSDNPVYMPALRRNRPIIGSLMTNLQPLLAAMLEADGRDPRFSGLEGDMPALQAPLRNSLFRAFPINPNTRTLIARSLGVLTPEGTIPEVPEDLAEDTHHQLGLTSPRLITGLYDNAARLDQAYRANPRSSRSNAAGSHLFNIRSAIGSMLDTQLPQMGLPSPGGRI